MQNGFIIFLSLFYPLIFSLQHENLDVLMKDRILDVVEYTLNVLRIDRCKKMKDSKLFCSIDSMDTAVHKTNASLSNQ